MLLRGDEQSGMGGWCVTFPQHERQAVVQRRTSLDSDTSKRCNIVVEALMASNVGHVIVVGDGSSMWW